MSFNASLLVMMAIFWVTYLILRVFFFKPMMDLLEERDSTITGAQSIYDEALSDANQKIEAEHTRLSEARSEAMVSRERERRTAQDRRQEQLNAVKARAQETLATAAKELEARVDQERASLAEQARELADGMVERLLGRPA